VAVIAFDDGAGGILIDRHDVAQLLRIELGRAHGRADQIVEHTVIWRRSASRVRMSMSGGRCATGAGSPLSSSQSVAMALSRARRWSTLRTPMSFRSSGVRSGNMARRISFSSNASAQAQVIQPLTNFGHRASQRTVYTRRLGLQLPVDITGRTSALDDDVVFDRPKSIPPYPLPHTSSAISTVSASLAHCSSSLSALPSSVLANPHCGLRQSCSSGT
jgi:hypothetical protein